MTAGHDTDSLTEAWELEPQDLVKGFLRVPFTVAEGTQHTYDNATTFVLARMVERVTGHDLREFLDERLFNPMGIDHAEWDRVASGAAFGFHGLHLTTEAIAAFGELLLREGRWGNQQLIPSDWVKLATSRPHGRTPHPLLGLPAPRPRRRNPGGLNHSSPTRPHRPATTPVAQASTRHSRPDRPLHTAPHSSDTRRHPRRLCPPRQNHGARRPIDGGWLLYLGLSLTLEVGHATWRESSPLGRPVIATGAWQNNTFIADLYVITTPHRVRLVLDTTTGKATARWNVVPLTTPNLTLHLQAPLTTRPDVA
jgi:hypothetical protein